MALQRGIVELETYSEKWKEDYKKEEELLKKVLGDRIIEIHHIGSTSIEGLMAKPVIDILIVIDDYENRGPQGVSDRFFFAKGPEIARSHYIHFTYPKSNTYYNQIYFKKYLIEHPEYIKKYCDLKQDLAKKYADERPKYTQGKNEFISEVIRLAKEEYDD